MTSSRGTPYCGKRCLKITVLDMYVDAHMFVNILSRMYTYIFQYRIKLLRYVFEFGNAIKKVENIDT